MKATIGNKIIATANSADVIEIEGNKYFPPTSVDWLVLEPSPSTYTCPWKGEAAYYSLIDGQKEVAWAYVSPSADAIQKVGRDFSKFVAFDRAVVVRD